MTVGGESFERDNTVCGGDLDVGSEEMATVVEGVFFNIGHIWVDDCDCHVALALVVDLNLELGRNLADTRVNEFTRLDCAVAKRDIDRDSWVESGKDVGDEVHLVDTLHNEETLVLAPLLVGEMAVDGFVQVAWRQVVLVLEIDRISSNPNLTQSVLESLLHHGVVDVCQNLQLLEVLLHARQTVLVLVLILWADLLRL